MYIVLVQGNPVITRSPGPPTLPRYNRYLVINKHMIKYIKCNAWDYTLISYITTYYHRIHATVMICFVTINRRKWIIWSLFGFNYSPKKWHSKQLKFICIAVRTNSLWRLVCVGRQVEWSTVRHKLLMEFSSAVLWFSMSCAISMLRN